MPHELVYTSAPRGLKPGSTGYCTVAHTPNLPKDLADQLEGISHYRHIQVGASDNPVSFAHSVLTVGYNVYHVVSRVADSGLDHSGRSNFLAHHVAFDPDEVPESGPAWLCEQRFFVQKWDRSPQQIPGDRPVPSGRADARVCMKWAKLAGDAGWGGVLAAATNAAEPAYILYEPGQDVLSLVAEAMALLPSEARWNVTFNTYFTGKAVRTTCQWRCVPVDSPEAKEALTARRGIVLRIDQPMSGVPSGPLVEAARTGEAPESSPRRRPASTVSTRAPARPAEFEVVPEPSLPPPRGRPRLDLPEPEPSDSQYDLEPPRPAAHEPARAGGGVGSLLLGMALGGLIALALLMVIEIALKSSPALSALNMKSDEHTKAEETAKKLQEELNSVSTERQRFQTDFASLQSKNKDLDASLLKLNDDLTKANKRIKELEAELEKKPAVAPPAAGPGGGLLGPALKIKNAQKQVHDLQARIGVLQKEIDDLKAKKPVAGPPTFEAVNVRRHAIEFNNAGGGLFMAPAGAEPLSLEVFGIPGLQNQGPAQSIAINKGTMIANLGIVPGGQVNLAGSGLDAHPLLGLAIIRVKSGNEVTHHQLFVPSGTQGDIPMESAGERKFTYDYKNRVTNTLLMREIAALKDAKQLAARNARITLDDPKRPFDLEPREDPLVLLYRREEQPELSLRVDGLQLVLEVKGGTPPKKARIEWLEVVRLIPADESRKFPAYTQELLRFTPK
jgi:hypothetical protein